MNMYEGRIINDVVVDIVFMMLGFFFGFAAGGVVCGFLVPQWTEKLMRRIDVWVEKHG